MGAVTWLADALVAEECIKYFNEQDEFAEIRSLLQSEINPRDVNSSVVKLEELIDKAELIRLFSQAFLELDFSRGFQDDSDKTDPPDREGRAYGPTNWCSTKDLESFKKLRELFYSNKSQSDSGNEQSEK